MMQRLFRAIQKHYFAPTTTTRAKIQLFGFVLLGIGIIFGSYFTLSGIIKRVFASNTNTEWTFTTSGDYTLSDSSLIETTGTTARLKLREYASDGSTALLLHLNEASGNPTDSSSNAATVTAANVTYETGKLSNGAVFTGLGSSLSVPDSTPLSISSTNTLEGWVNFDTTFTDTSHSERQTIFDKGAYQLYFEHTSGKLVYELEPTGTKAWTQKAGPNLDGNNGQSINTTWDLNGKTNIYSSVKMGTDVYVAIGTATGINDAEVWRCASCDTGTPTWTKVGGDGAFTSWPMDTYEYAASLATDGTYLYAGLGGTAAGDGDLWRCTGCGGGSPSWTKVGGDAVSSSWAASTYESVTALVVNGSTVYAGIGNNAAGDAEVYRCTSCDTTPAWSRIGGDAVSSSWANSTYEEVRSLALIGSNLVAGIGNTAGDGEVWSTDTTSISWVKRGGDGSGVSGQSWGSTYEQINGLGGASNILYVGTGTTPALEAEVWRCDLSSTCTATAGWTKVGGDGANTSFNTNYESVRSILVSGTTVYVGIGDSVSDAEVWKCTSCDGATPTWSQIAGDGNGLAGQSWGATQTQVNTMYLDGTTLYVGASSTSWSSEFWRCDVGGTCSSTAGWTRLGGGYANNSWEIVGLYTVQEIASGDSKMYAGTGNAQAGDAMVWQYDNTTDTWTIIGGQGFNSGWGANTYESVDSLLYHKGMLYAGLGRSTGDGELWRWNGSTWTQVGGDGVFSSWNTNYENVASLVVYMDKLYAGIGNNGNGDAEVYRCTSCEAVTPSWTKVAGDGIFSGWAAGTFREVPALVQANGYLFAGLAGGTAGDAEVWRCSSSCDGGTPVWSRVGGDGTSSGWANSVYERVDSLAVYEGKIVAALGSTAGDAEVWICNSCDGTANWGGSKIGGDDVSGSSGSTYGWADSTYEQIFDMVTYNGYLYVGLGITAGESEVWRYDTSSWEKVGGDGVNSSWDATINYVNSLAVFEGKLYAGTGGDANADATIWSYGNDSVTKSAVLSLTADTWYHVAATYDGSNMKLFVNGTQSGSSYPTTITVLDNTKNLLIGRAYGSRGNVSAAANFMGSLDELRISSTNRSSFTTTPYSSDAQTVRLASAVYTSGIKTFDSFTTQESGGGTITYRLSNDNGSTWKYYTGGAWTTSASTSQVNSAATISTNIATFPVGSGGIVWQAILTGNGSEQVTLSSVNLFATTDPDPPTNPDTLTSLSAVAGSAITTDTWYAHTAPSFTWSGASDGAGAGIAGYYVYFGTESSAEPSTDAAATFQAGTTFTAGSLTSGQTYYLRIRAKDSAGNLAASTWSAFTYKFDSTGPTNPTTVSVSPAGYAPTNDFTFSWPAGSDAGSQLAGYQYKTGTSSGTLSDWSTATTSATISLSGAAYATDSNTFYLRTIDVAGNVSSAIQALYYYAGDGPTAPRNLNVSPQTNTANSFAFSWDAPTSYSGTTSTLKYCYTINTLPSAITCNFTSAGATALSASSFATQTGLNTFYVVAKNADDVGGAINYGAYTSVSFTANTSAPGIPQSADIADVSVKSTESWKLAVSWDAPADTGSGVENYEIYRSADDTTYTKIATTTGIAYVDTGLSQSAYYYKVKACDNVSNCGAFTTAVTATPTGKFTTAPTLSSGPTVSGITTKQATITWSTDRSGDSKIQYGTGAGTYGASEPSNSKQVSDHTITLTNLSPGTTYYFKAKWTDEDGNTGSSAEKSFTTDPAPTISEVSVKNISLSSAFIAFTSNGASKVKIYYGETSAFGAVKTVETSTTESSYTAQVEDLKDGTKYFYKINGFDSEDAEYEGTILSFETLPRPKISTVRIQQVKGTAQPTVLVSWTTNTETSSIATYYPEGQPSQARDEVNVNLQKGEHRIIIRGLLAETPYLLVVKGRDKAGNEAASDAQRLTTATDTRPPQISGLKVEGNVQVSASSSEGVASLVVNWTTDEPSTSQVEYGEGTGTTYSQKSQEDSNLAQNHVIIITGLTPSKVYHLRALSKDKASNLSQSVDTVNITPKATENALNLVISNLQQVFGFLGALQQ